MNIRAMAFVLALVPVLTVALCYALSVAAGYLPTCWPWWDGCTTISATARHGQAWWIFKLIMLPLALLSTLFWWQLTKQMQRAVTAPAIFPGLRALSVVLGLALALYVWFLGSDGYAFAVLRRVGASSYFGATLLCQLLTLAALSRDAQIARRARIWLGVPVFMQIGLGLGSLPITLWAEAAAKDRWENAIEWQFASLMQLYFLALALLYRPTGLEPLRRRFRQP